MYIQTALASLALLPFALCAPSQPPSPQPYYAYPPTQAITTLTQGGYKFALTIDSKQWSNLSQVMTKDIYYDSSALGAGYGGVSVGIDQVTAALEASAPEGIYWEHLVTNLYLEKLNTPTNASSITYITVSRWDPSALHDITKTYRIYYRCDDQWLLQDGSWKLDHSIVRNTGPRVEAPYFGSSS
ncbi:hypothetical protein PRZ48_012254 [Zasmidium cellare]|uniref:SnoaL-like domain-containing protein n=1 Tax=Zasmidium cellare TaxID=395010 RepID=A0ABR0E4L7_ZASCE|nr:hypothetical protein PRZ48_012254 [Zasmidium cellare]